MWAWSPPQQQAIFNIFHFQFKIDKKYKYLSKHSVNIPYDSHNKKIRHNYFMKYRNFNRTLGEKTPLQGLIYWGGLGGPGPSNNFSDFCFAKCNKTCSGLHLCCHLNLSRQQIMVDLWAATWLHTSVLPGFHFGFELKNNYHVIINI